MELDLLTTNRIAEATQSIQGKHATLVLPWGSRLPFVKEGGEWKFDYFRLPGVLPAKQYARFAAGRNRVLTNAAVALENGDYSNIDEAYSGLQERLRNVPR